MTLTKRELDDPDLEDLRREDERVRRRSGWGGCVCGDRVLPGRCPGRWACPLVGVEECDEAE